MAPAAVSRGRVAAVAGRANLFASVRFFLAVDRRWRSTANECVMTFHIDIAEKTKKRDVETRHAFFCIGCSCYSEAFAAFGFSAFWSSFAQPFFLIHFSRFSLATESSN